MTTTPTSSRAHGWATAVLAIAALCCGGAASANPVPPVYIDFPTGPGTFASQEGGPILADDFTSTVNKRIVLVEWWGSYSNDPWQLTLYSNSDADPALPDDGGSVIALVEPGWAREWDDGIYHYRADVDDPAWVLARGQSYWFSVASYRDDWTWAFGTRWPRLDGLQNERAVGSPDGLAWDALIPPTNLAFGVWPELVPEPGSLSLLGLGLLGLAVSRQRLAGHRPSA